jgi:hypothetical protein
MIDDARCGEPHPLLSSLNMLLETPGGSEYSVAECTLWMREAGFTSIVDEPLGRLHKAVIAIK